MVCSLPALGKVENSRIIPPCRAWWLHDFSLTLTYQFCSGLCRDLALCPAHKESPKSLSNMALLSSSTGLLGPHHCPLAQHSCLLLAPCSCPCPPHCLPLHGHQGAPMSAEPGPPSPAHSPPWLPPSGSKPKSSLQPTGPCTTCLSPPWLLLPLSSLSPLLQPPRPLCYLSIMWGSIPPQGLCTHHALFLDCCSSRSILLLLLLFGVCVCVR
jgi:hypothetical protein